VLCCDLQVHPLTAFRVVEDPAGIEAKVVKGDHGNSAVARMSLEDQSGRVVRVRPRTHECFGEHLHVSSGGEDRPCHRGRRLRTEKVVDTSFAVVMAGTKLGVVVPFLNGLVETAQDKALDAFLSCYVVNSNPPVDLVLLTAKPLVLIKASSTPSNASYRDAAL
jgi:hypothetical protein